MRARWMNGRRGDRLRGTRKTRRSVLPSNTSWVDQLTGPDPSVLRAGILDLLELLGDAAAQERYEDSVSIADVPSELRCMWFDDAYLPDSPAFQAAFTVVEQDALADFNRFFDSRVDALPSGGGVRALHRSADWIEIMAAAGAVRARIVRPPNRA